MSKQFVIVKADIYCNWEGNPPNYRAWVNDELFTERTYIWKDEYLEEMLQIFAEPGKYQLKWELVPPFTGQLTVKNLRVEGPGRVIKNNTLRIDHEST